MAHLDRARRRVLQVKDVHRARILAITISANSDVGHTIVIHWEGRG